jgi:hydrogenase maturation protease
VNTAPHTLVIGYGNPGRQDDGLGPALADALEGRAPARVDVDSDYQLNVEYAAQVARYRTVLFADADRSGPAPFWVRRIHAESAAPGFSTHSVRPGTVLALARELFHAEPEAWLLGIRGYEFDEFGEGLSEKAASNLAAAIEYLEAAIREDRFREVRPEGARTERNDEGEPCKTEST